MDILNLALDMKKNPEKYAHALEGKKLYTLFEKTSTRTFLSFTTGITELGGTYYNQLWKDSNFTLGEPVSEIKYVCRNVDIIMARLVKNETVELFGDNVTVPFINGCDSSYHPCQTLADALTIIEVRKSRCKAHVHRCQEQCIQFTCRILCKDEERNYLRTYTTCKQHCMR